MTSAHSILSNEALSLEVSSLGAEMQYLRSDDGSDLLWSGDPAFWSGRAPVLFPIVGRAVDDKIAVGGQTASLAQHGFARRNQFELEEHSQTMCRHVLRATTETKAVYPFDFTLQITHALDATTLNVSARVSNHSATTMPFGFGFHPAFRWPLPNSKDAPHAVNLAQKGTPSQRALSPDGLLSPDLTPGPFVDGRLEITEPLFTDGALVFPNGSDTLRYGPDNGLSLSFQFHNLPDLALWKPQGAPFLCIEPWHGTASLQGDGPEIADRPNSVKLAPGDSIEFGYSVTIDTAG